MWHILGVGAIGACWARKLRMAGEDVCLILRDKDRLQTFRDEGSLLSFVNLDGTTEAMRFNATDVSSIDRKIENLLICTKSYALENAYLDIESHLSKTAKLVILCNGYGPQQRVAALADRFCVWGATTTEGANRTTAFRVHLAGSGSTQIGALNELARQYQTPLTQLDDHNTIANIDLALWQKLAINACINPMSLIYGVPNGELVEDYALRIEMTAIAMEITLLARALRKPLFEESLIEVVTQVCNKTHTNDSSMLQDFRAHRPTEINEITGTLVRMADDARIKFAKNRQLLAKVEAIYASQN